MRKILINNELPDLYSSYLEQLGEVIRIPHSNIFSSPISSHPDLLIGKIDDTLFVNKDEKALIDTLEQNHIIFQLSDDLCSSCYPQDCHYNFFQIGPFLFAKESTLCRAAKEYISNFELTLINLNQGYTKCSTTILNNAIITADVCIAKQAKEHGIDCCTIQPGGIRLFPYDYGFIGGATAFIDNKLIFFGDAHALPSYDTICTFCKARNISIIDFKEPLTDYGGVVLV